MPNDDHSARFILGVDNPQDPTRNVAAQNAQLLFQKVAAVATGFGYDDVIDVAANLIINSLRQKYSRRRDALEKYSELTNKVASLLSAHYDPTTGNRRNIFPFTQTITANLFVDEDKG
jgi:hypothetical protein